MTTAYGTDIVAWANEQAALLRAGRFSELDIEHISDEVEDVGKSETHELANRMSILLSHLLKWEYQSERRGSSWENTINNQRERIEIRLKKTPSLRSSLTDDDWVIDAYLGAKAQASSETSINIADFPKNCPWNAEQIMDTEFFPGKV
jgi:Domain of unknown function DUF29